MSRRACSPHSDLLMSITGVARGAAGNPFVSVGPLVSALQVVMARSGPKDSSATWAVTIGDTDTNGGTDTDGVLRMTTRR